MGGIPGESDGARLARMGTDAAVWALELSDALTTEHVVPPTAQGAHLAIKPDPAPGGLLHGWLCAAIETGRSAGYAQGRRDAQEIADELAREIERHGVAVTRPRESGVAATVQLFTGALSWPVPADLAGSVPADLAGRSETVPADLAGSSDLGRIADALERLAAAVAPHGHPMGAGLRVIGDGR